MATVTLSRYECTADLLPAVCAACGRPAADRVSHTFTWRPLWHRARSLGDWLTNRTATVRLPLCPDDARYARRKHRALLLSLLFLVSYGVGASVFLWDFPPPIVPWTHLTVFVAATVLLLAWSVATKVYFPEQFHAGGIDERFLTLKGVDPQFAAAAADRSGPNRDRPGDRPAPTGAPTAGEDDRAGGDRPPGPDRLDVTLTEAEYQDDRLPPVCALCAAPAPDRVPRHTRIVPQGLACLLFLPLIVGLVFFPPLFLLLVLSATRRTEVRVPMCPDHQDHWAAIDRFGNWFQLPVWFVLATSFTMLAMFEPEYRWWYLGGSVLTLLAALALERVVSRGAVLVLAGDGTDVRLRRVHREFAAALTAIREQHRPELPERPDRADDEWDDYDDEAIDPPRRGPRDDWHDEYR